MKLYYWDNLESKCSYTNGLAFALADTKEEAIEAIMKQQREERVAYMQRNPDSSGYPSVQELVSIETELNETTPKVFSTTVGFAIEGSA